MVEKRLSFPSSIDNRTTEMENYVSHMGQRQLVDRYTDYPTSNDQHFYYTYEPPLYGHVASKHPGRGGDHKSKAAMSALTLLAFLFFLHILQQCIRDHMTAMSSSPFVIMSAGKEANENLANNRIKLDKTAQLDAATDQRDDIADHEKRLTRVSTYQPINNGHKHRDPADFSKFVNAMDKK